MRLLIIIVLFLLIGGFIIMHAYSLNLTSEEDREMFMFRFADWTINLGQNMASVVGYAVAMDWLPEVEDGNRTRVDG